MSLPSLTSDPQCTLPIYCADSTGCLDCIEKLKDIASQLSELTKRQAAILARVNSRRDPISSKLPPEVVYYIFEEYVRLHQVNPLPQYLPLSEEIHAGIPQYFDTFHRSAPLRLGSVCQKWRQLAWSNPKLWNSLLVHLDIGGYLHGAELVTEWLARSKTLPLDIKLDRGWELDGYEHRYSGSADTPSSTQSPFNSAVAIVLAINEVSSRWRSLDFMGVDPHITIYLTDDALDSEPGHLQHLSASRHNVGFDDATSLFDKAKQNHSPTHLAIDWAQVDRPVDIDFSRLTHLHLTQVRLSNLWALIKDVSESRALLLHLVAREIEDVGNLYSIYSDFNPSSVITLAALHSLSITTLHPWPMERARDILNHLKLPALQSLHYTALEATFPGEVLCSLIQRSGCALHHLILDEATDSEQNLSSLLHSVPTLNKLTVSFHPLNWRSWLFEFMCLSHSNALDGGSGTPFLPMLQHLHVTSCNYSDWSLLLKGSPPPLSSHFSPPQERFQLDTVKFVQNYTRTY